jgi:hypothetical protein
VAALAEEMLTPEVQTGTRAVTVAVIPVLSTPHGRQLNGPLEGLEFMLSIDFYINETTRYRPDSAAPPRHDHYDSTFNAFAVRSIAPLQRCW